MELPFTPIPLEQVRDHKIYLIANTKNGRRYVGRTGGPVGRRWHKHIDDSRLGFKSGLYDDIRLHGADAFEVFVIEDALNSGDAGTRERHWIAALETMVEQGGYNAHRQSSRPPSTEIRSRKRRPEALDRLDGAPRQRPRVSRRIGRPVLQCDAQWRFIRRFESLVEAGRYTGVIHSQIGQVCLGRTRSAGGFRWMYADDPRSGSLQPVADPMSQKLMTDMLKRPVRQLTRSGEEVARFESVGAAAAAMGVCHAAISAVVCGRSKSSCGYVWADV